MNRDDPSARNFPKTSVMSCAATRKKISGALIPVRSAGTSALLAAVTVD
jgi:hypothetical protein